MKYVLFYEASPDAATIAPAHFPAHRELLDEFHRRGDLLMVGTFTDLAGRGAMAIFTNPGAAERVRRPGSVRGVRGRGGARGLRVERGPDLTGP